MRALALILIVLLCGCSKSTWGKALNGGVVGAAVADNVTTSQAEARGGREANRIMGDSEIRRWLLKGVGVGMVIAAAHALERDRAVWAQILRVAAIGVYGGAALWNHGRLR